MGTRAFRKVLTPDEATNRNFDELEEVVQWVNNIVAPIANRPDDGVVMYDTVALEVAYRNRVEHKLGKVPIGWRIVRVDGPAVIWEHTTTTNDVYLDLITTLDCVVSIEVF